MEPFIKLLSICSLLARWSEIMHSLDKLKDRMKTSVFPSHSCTFRFNAASLQLRENDMWDVEASSVSATVDHNKKWNSISFLNSGCEETSGRVAFCRVNTPAWTSRAHHSFASPSALPLITSLSFQLCVIGYVFSVGQGVLEGLQPCQAQDLVLILAPGAKRPKI